MESEKIVGVWLTHCKENFFKVLFHVSHRSSDRQLPFLVKTGGATSALLFIAPAKWLDQPARGGEQDAA
jgi:hypothetical protein